MNEKVVLGIRILLGLGLVLFGSNKFLHFMETPPLSPEAGEFMGAMLKQAIFCLLLERYKFWQGFLF